MTPRKLLSYFSAAFQALSQSRGGRRGGKGDLGYQNYPKAEILLLWSLLVEKQEVLLESNFNPSCDSGDG